MGFKVFAYLAFVATHAITAIPTEERSETHVGDSQLEKVFAHSLAGTIIAGYLPPNDLQNMAEIPIMSESANFVLNRRTRILHYRDGIISPPYLAKAYELESRQNLTNFYDKKRFWGHHWIPELFVMFGNQNPINLIGGTTYRHIVMVVPKKNHLMIFDETVPSEKNERTLRNVMAGEGSPMNGVIIPRRFSPQAESFYRIRRISLAHDFRPSDMHLGREYPVVLAILINSESDDREVTRNRGINAAEMIGRELNTSICVIAQADTRSNEEKLREKSESLLLVFHKIDTGASTLVVGTEDTKEALKSKFESWKEKLFFLDDHQTIAFHFTMVNGTEPENSEELFSETFPDIPLSTLCLRDQSSTVGVNDEGGFHDGPIYVILGFRKFGSKNIIEEKHTKKRNWEVEPSTFDGVKRQRSS